MSDNKYVELKDVPVGAVISFDHSRKGWIKLKLEKYDGEWARGTFMNEKPIEGLAVGNIWHAGDPLTFRVEFASKITIEQQPA